LRHLFPRNRGASKQLDIVLLVILPSSLLLCMPRSLLLLPPLLKLL
jgi:hypothetical protein